MASIFIVPSKGIKVPFPDNPKMFVPEGGVLVNENVYWTRRLIEKSISIKEKENIVGMKEKILINKDKKGGK